MLDKKKNIQQKNLVLFLKNSALISKWDLLCKKIVLNNSHFYS